MQEAQRTRIFAAIGLGQGLVFVICHELWPGLEGPAVARAMVPVFAAAVAGLCLEFTFGGGSRRRWLATAALTAAAFSLPALWVFLHAARKGGDYMGDNGREPYFWMASTVGLYAIAPYLQIWVATGKRRFPYPQLFFHAWNNALIALFGAAYMGVFTLLSWLCAGLFSVLNIEVVHRVVQSPRYWLVCLPVLAGVGVATGSANVRLIDSLRAALLAVFRFLMPLYAGISVAFLLALPFTGVQPIWDTGHASFLLLGTVIAGAVFLNAVYEDGSRPLPYPTPVTWLVRAAFLGLPIYAGLSLYALWLRAEQYGLSPERVWGWVVAIVLTGYALCYASAAARQPGQWGRVLGWGNVALSFLVIAIVFAIHSPALDPLQLSLRNQVSRLLSGHVSAAEFDFESLRFDLGQAGNNELQRLSKLDGAESTGIREGATRALAATSKQYRSGGHELTADNLHPVGMSALPDGLLTYANDALSTYRTDDCTPAHRCLVFEVPRSEGPSLYCFLLGSQQSACFETSPGPAWAFTAALVQAPNAVPCAPCDWRELLKEGEPRPVDATDPDVRIGSTRFRLRSP